MMKMRNKPLSIVKGIIAILLVTISIFPILWMVSVSVRTTAEMSGGKAISLFPQSLTIEHYINLFTQKDFGTALKNSIIVTGASVFVSLVIGICCAYILARNRFYFRGKTGLTYWVLLVRVLPPITFAVPLYIMFAKIGWLNTLLPEICACAFVDIPLVIWFLISFFQDLPIELEESAKIDGAREWQVFRRIVLPLVLPGIAAVSMLSFVYAWNEYTYGVVFVQSPQNYTVPLKLAILNTEDNITQYGVVAASSIISIVPMSIFIVFAQKYIISRLSSGAVKG